MEHVTDNYLTRWSADLKVIKALPTSPAKDQRILDHLGDQATVRQAHPEPVERAFVSILSSSDCSIIAATLIQGNKNKDLAESELTLFKLKLGPKLSMEMLGIWNDPDIPCVDKASNHGK